GNVVETAAYSYDPRPSSSYLELLLSVQEVDPQALIPIRAEAQRASDAEIVAAISACIRDQVRTRMRIAQAVMQQTQASRRAVLNVLDRYTGDDTERHHWRYSLGARRAWVYELLEDEDPDAP